MNTWVDPFDRTWVYAPPATTNDVLNGALVALAPILATTSAGKMPGSEHLQPLLSYLASVTDHVCLPSERRVVVGADFSHAEMVEYIDCELTTEHHLEYLNAIKASVSVPSTTLDHIAAYYAISYDGGCECPTCEGRPSRVKVPCRYAEIPVHVYPWVQRYSVVSDDPVLTAPYWVYQIKEIERRESGKMYREAERKRREDERKREVDRQLKRMGIT